ncbi:hypothetical protein BDN72DRAFT_805468 [Pluteus cervinus]|uniref:Uncharacterized protein n=1 Tax=Pluteus cervinus TaxID=181527 RepID=A0ACD3A5U4_9AGAR|nr:hypothetical protein BDN72DRAFT_805468 [Pluteus cervinus]
MDIGSSRVIQQKRARIQAKILKHELAIVELKKQLNASTPINSVPSDVLLCIFQDVQSPSKSARPGEDQHPDYPGMERIQWESQLQWVKALTHVCAGWRELALDTPLLWTRIKLATSAVQEFEGEMLKRSRSAPISLFYRTVPFRVLRIKQLQPSVSPWDVFGQHMHRTKLLRLELGRSDYDTLVRRLPSFMIKPTALEECSFSLLDREVGTITLPRQLLLPSASTLKYLHLKACTFDFPTRPTDRDIIHLPQLSRLSISALLDTAITAITHLAVPPTCSVSVEVWGAGEQELTSLKPIVSAFWSAKVAQGRYLRKLVFEEFIYNGIRIAFSESEDDSQSDLVLMIHNDLYYDSLSADFLLNLLPAAPLKRVHKLVVGLPVGHLVWGLLANSCPNLLSISTSKHQITPCLVCIYIGDPTPIILRNEGRSGVWRLTGFRTSEFAHERRDSKPFRRLKKLEFCEIHFTSLDRELLLRSVEHRARLNIPIRSLAVSENCGSEGGYLEKLSLSVKEIWTIPNPNNYHSVDEDWPDHPDPPRPGDFDYTGSD